MQLGRQPAGQLVNPPVAPKIINQPNKLNKLNEPNRPCFRHGFSISHVNPCYAGDTQRVHEQRRESINDCQAASSDIFRIPFTMELPLRPEKIS